MTLLGFTVSRQRVKNAMSEEAACEAVGAAVSNGDIGGTLTAVQKLILRYYDNVRGQADESFQSAKKVALFDFVLLVITVAYVIFMDLMPHISTRFVQHAGGIGVGAIGLIDSSVIEVIAGIQFVLYGRATRQFGAFHICLERTHRYLMAYEIAEHITTNKDRTLEKVVCIMANAPMITHEDIDGVRSSKLVRPKESSKGRSAVAIPQEA
jgi:hypothetical protein